MNRHNRLQCMFPVAGIEKINSVQMTNIVEF